MRVLVTGASGFVGGYLIEELLRRGHMPVAMVRKGSDAARLKEVGVECRTGDLTDPESLVAVVKGADAVIHLAAYYTFTGKRELYEMINVEGTRHLMDAMLANGVKRLLYCSSTEVMGPTPDPPADESAPCHPIYEYGHSKLRAEEMVRDYAKKGIEPTIVRPSGIYGPRNLEDVSFWFITTFANSIVSRFIIGSGKKKLQFVHVEDVAQAFALALERPEVSNGQTYIVTDERAYNYEEIYGILARIFKKDPPRRHLPVALAKLIAAPVQAINAIRGKQNFIWRVQTMDTFKVDRWYSIEKVRRELGYSPRNKLEEGLRQTVRWYEQNGYIRS